MQSLHSKFALIITAALFTLPNLSSAQAFNCNNQGLSRIEKMICASPNLLRADEELNQSYRLALADHDDPKDLTEGQRIWIQIRNRCASSACLEQVYQSRLASLKSTVNCAKPNDQFEKLVCEARTEDDLRAVSINTVNQWKPYYLKGPYLGPHPDETWADDIQINLKGIGVHCRTLNCKRAEAANFIRNYAFPESIYRTFVTWISAQGDHSPFVTSTQWELDSDKAEPFWKTIDGGIYVIGSLPAWIKTDFDPSVGNSPSAAPPFLARKLTAIEALKLERVVSRVPQFLSSSYPTIGPFSASLLQSVNFTDGGSAHCSANPLASSTWIRDAFPYSPNKTTDYLGKSYKIVERRAAPVEQRVPTCSTDDPYPDGFFPAGKITYTSDIVIDDIKADGIANGPFIRPDGTFWLQFSNGMWIRFRRNMTTDAPEFGSKFIVVSKDDFDKFADESKTMAELSEKLRNLFPHGAQGLLPAGRGR